MTTQATEYVQDVSEVLGNTNMSEIHIFGTSCTSIYQLLKIIGKEFKTGIDFQEKGPMGECFRNAAHAALGYDLVYCEGYAIPRNLHIPLMHAWCVDPKTGNVLETTWELGASYHGIQFKTDFLLKAILALGVYGIIENIYRLPPELKTKPKNEVIVYE